MNKEKQPDDLFPSIIAHAKEYGFIFPSSDIYEGLSAVYDYGPYGCELKRNIREYWWQWMTLAHDHIVGIDAAIFMHPTTWKASGHIDSFSDPMIDNLDSKKRYRVDHLIELHAEELKKNNQTALADTLLQEMDACIAQDNFTGLKELIDRYKIKCSVSNTCNWTPVRQFNLMFSTQLGSVSDEANTIYLRPETAQGIFANFLNVQKTARMKIPFGIAQVGKAFRNEIVARQFIFRMREFEQMEMQFFVKPGSQKDWYIYWKEERLKWYKNIGIPVDNLRYHDHVKTAHYADAAVDIEFNFPFGFKEVEGIHSRTDFDLSQHQKFSGKKMQYFDTETNQHFIPYVIETSVGLDRLVLLILCNAYKEEVIKKENGPDDSRVVLKIPPPLAPIKLAVLPLTKKDGLPEIARAFIDTCKTSFKCFYEEKDTIGKRYRRQDAIGTPFCVTIDHQTKDDQTATIRYRDSMLQERLPLEEIKKKISAIIRLPL
ncbi:MAG: glycine--tRNA ligase [Phycisphaerales bacterium]|nr:glycine--tRNA ligase [Phycisphaerales bacterium]